MKHNIKYVFSLLAAVILPMFATADDLTINVTPSVSSVNWAANTEYLQDYLSVKAGVAQNGGAGGSAFRLTTGAALQYKTLYADITDATSGLTLLLKKSNGTNYSDYSTDIIISYISDASAAIDFYPYYTITKPHTSHTAKIKFYYYTGEVKTYVLTVDVTINMTGGYAITTVSDPIGGGSISVQVDDEDRTQIMADEIADITATPNDNYEFVGWELSDDENGLLDDAYEAATLMTVLADQTLTAVFNLTCSVPVITFSSATVDKLLTDGTFTNTATIKHNDTPTGQTLTYTSSNTSVATVNGSTGEITIGDTPGSTTITASADGNATYCAAEGSYTLNVRRTGTASFAQDEIRIASTGEVNNILTTNSDGVKTFISSNTDVATVNPATGAVTIVAHGTTDISVSIAQSATTTAVSSVSYTLTVYDYATTGYRVSCPTWNVTYDANIDSPTGIIPEPAPYEEDEEVTLAADLSKAGYRWDGWMPKQGGTPIEVTDGKFIMPTAAVTVEGQWTDMRPALSVTDLYVTSAKDITTLSSMAISATSTASAHSSGTLTIEDADGTESGSFHAVITDADADGEGLNATIRIEYTPAADSITEETAVMTATIGGYSSTFTVHGRSLPKRFIVAAAQGGVYSALPADIMSSNTWSGYCFASDNEADPTKATLAPTGALFRYYGNSLKTKDYIRLASCSTGNTLWSSTSNGIRVYASIGGGSAKGDQYEWLLTTDDNTNYTLYNSAAQSGAGCLLGVNNDRKWGMNVAGSPVTTLRLLPVAATADLITITASDWTNTSFDFTTSSTPPAAHHITVVADATEYAAEISSDKLTASTADFSSLAGRQLLIQWRNSTDDVLAQGAVIIPIIVDEDTETDLSQFPADVLKVLDVYVSNGKELQLTSSVQVHNVTLNTGSTLNIATTDANAGITMSLNTLSMRGGWNANGNKYDVPRIYIDPKSSLTKTVTTVNYDINIYNSTEGRHYYPLAVPFPVPVSSIDYADPALAEASVYNKHYVIKTYNGAARAINGTDKDNNWTVVPADGTLQPGTGYIITAVAVGGQAVIRIPMTITNAWTALGEQATVDAVTKNQPTVTAHTGAAATLHTRHAGWNYLGVPYMSCFGASETMYEGVGAASLINGQLVLSADSYDYDDADIPYVSVPSHDFAEYFQTDITETQLRPCWGFFVQVGSSGSLSFLSSQRQEDENAPLYVIRREKEIYQKHRVAVMLQNENTTSYDKTTLIFSNQYTDEYEIGADLEKMFGEGYTLALYSVNNDTRLAFNALPDASGTVPLGVRIPTDGMYVFALPQNNTSSRYDLTRYEHLYLIDYETGNLTDLLTNTYSFVSAKQQNDTRFALMPVLRSNTPTDTDENLNFKTEPQKIIIDGILYIIRDGKIYNLNGNLIRH